MRTYASTAAFKTLTVFSLNQCRMNPYHYQIKIEYEYKFERLKEIIIDLTVLI
jgi:hypothetical protein